MTTSSVPGAIDYLVGLAGQATTGIAGAVVADGWTDERSATMFGVGIDAPPFFAGETATVEGSAEWAGLGAKRVEEKFSIPGYIYVGIGSTSNQTVRNEAFAVWNAFLPLLIADLTLGGSLTGGRIAAISQRSTQGAVTPEEAQGGRFCLIRFAVRCASVI